MEFVKNAVGGGDDQGENTSKQGQEQAGEQQGSGGGGLLGDLGSKLHGIVGGSKVSDRNDGNLNKGIDAVQQSSLDQGKQNQHSAVEHAKDEQISDYIRDKYKSTTG